jgi:hypothetical protein
MPIIMPVEAHCQEDRGINAMKMAGNENVRKTKISELWSVRFIEKGSNWE